MDNRVYVERDEGLDGDKQNTLTMTQSEKELRLINLNKEAIEKRDEMMSKQAVDVESSFASSQLPEDKRSQSRKFKATLIESVYHLKKEKASKFLTKELTSKPESYKEQRQFPQTTWQDTSEN